MSAQRSIATAFKDGPHGHWRSPLASRKDINATLLSHRKRAPVHSQKIVPIELGNDPDELYDGDDTQTWI